MPRPGSKKNGGTIRGASGKPRGGAPATQQTEVAPPEPGGSAKTNVAHAQSTVHQTACDLLAALHRVEQELCLSGFGYKRQNGRRIQGVFGPFVVQNGGLWAKPNFV